MLLAAVAIYGVGASSAFSYADLQVSGASLTDQARIEDAHVGRPRPEPVRAAGPVRSRPPWRGLTDGRRRQRRRPAAGTLAVTHPRTRAAPDLADRCPAVRRRCRRRPVRAAPGRSAGLDRGPAGHRRSTGIVGRPERRSAAVAGRSRRGDPAGVVASDRCRQHGIEPRRSLVTDENGFVLRARPNGLVGGLRLLHADHSHDGAHPRPGAPPPQPAGRPRADRRARGARVRDRRHLRPAGTAEADGRSPSVDAVAEADDQGRHRNRRRNRPRGRRRATTAAEARPARVRRHRAPPSGSPSPEPSRAS